jgi:hypothetical protein
MACIAGEAIRVDLVTDSDTAFRALKPSRDRPLKCLGCDNDQDHVSNARV